MASSINASTASGGGIITSADASGILQLQTAGTTAVTIDASQNVTLAGTLTGVGSGLTGTASGLTAGNATTAASCSGNSATATTAASCSGNSATATTAASCSGNSATATTLIGNETNWAAYRTSAVANMLSWKNYGNNHVIFDASASTAPNGIAVNNTTAVHPWLATYPALMGWNGYQTFGVRVDSARIADGATQLSTASGSAPSYSARAWVNFNGTGTVAIRASGNVSSITDNGTGNYTVNFTTAMPDANYSTNVTVDGNQPGVDAASSGVRHNSLTTTSVGIGVHNANNAASDYPNTMAAIFR